MVLPYIDMNPPRVYMCFPSWIPLPPPYLYHPSGSSQCTSPKHLVSCIEPGLAISFLYDIIHVSMSFSKFIPPSPSPTESKRLFYTSVSLLLSRIQGYHYHLSKFHIYALVYLHCQQRSVCSMLWFFPWSRMDVRIGLWRKLSAEELMLLNCGVGEDSWESLGLQGDPSSPF